VQSWVTDFDVRPGDAMLSVLVGSHKQHANLYTDTVDVAPKDPKNDWYQLDSAFSLLCNESKQGMRLNYSTPFGVIVVVDT
jgi:hypothetical protein